jgi:hypothetical protein
LPVARIGQAARLNVSLVAGLADRATAIDAVDTLAERDGTRRTRRPFRTENPVRTQTNKVEKTHPKANQKETLSTAMISFLA